jgi:hypothetical protein
LSKALRKQWECPGKPHDHWLRKVAVCGAAVIASIAAPDRDTGGDVMIQIPETARPAPFQVTRASNLSFTVRDSTEPGYATREISATQALIGEHGISKRLFCPVGNFGLLGPHLLNEEALAYLMEQRFTCIAWNSVPHDRDDPAHWVERCLSDVAKQDWTVVVLHDIENASLKRLPELLVGLDELGIEIVQHFPEEVVLIRDEKTVSLQPGHVARVV